MAPVVDTSTVEVVPAIKAGGPDRVSEIVTVPGISYLGTIPEEVQQPTIFCAVVTAQARQPEAAAELIRFLASPAAAEALRRTGLEPLSRG